MVRLPCSPHPAAFGCGVGTQYLEQGIVARYAAVLEAFGRAQKLEFAHRAVFMQRL